MAKLDHIGIAVKDLEEGKKKYAQILRSPCYKEEEVESEGVITAFFQAGDTKIELLGATREDSPIARFLEKRGPGIHHIALEVEDIQAEIQRLGDLGYAFIQTSPKKGADNKWICFLHPKSTDGCLIELCQDGGDL